MDDETSSPLALVLPRKRARTPAKKDPAKQAVAVAAKRELCTAKVRQRPNMKKAAGPGNEYLLNPDGTVQSRPCKNVAILGGVVCPKHGGKAPQVRKKADQRLLAMVDPSLIRLEALIHQDEHPPTALGAIRTVLERAGSRNPIGPQAKDVGDTNTRPIINILIKPGGLEKPVVAIAMQAPAGNEATEGQVIDGDGDPDED